MIELPSTEYHIAHGIDVSKWQRNIDWQAVAERSTPAITFVYVRSHYGRLQDPLAERNINEARAHGLHVGCYQYIRACESANDHLQALFLDSTKLLDACDLPPAIDIEQDVFWDSLGKDHVRAVASDWLTGAAALGFRPLVYTNFSSGVLLGLPQQFAEFDLWIADHTESPPRIPPPWKHHAIHQWTAKGTVSGIFGHVDLNVAVERVEQ